MFKKPSIALQKFIEGLIADYGLEKDILISPALEKELGRAGSLKEKMFLKSVYDENIKKHLALKKPLEDVLPSFALYKIIEKTINKEVGLNEIKKLIEEKLKISPEQAEEISQKISHNDFVIKEMEAMEKEEEAEDGSAPAAGQIKPKGLNQELL
jgi:hypothetical protein